MFKTDKDYKFAKDSTQQLNLEQGISPDDRLQMQIFTNTGFQLVDVFGSVSGGAAGSGNTASYLVEQTGDVKLPILGKVNLKGKSVKEAEKILEEKYSQYFIDPFVILRIANRYAYVFQGEQGGATVVNLEKDNTSIFEVLAKAGGVNERSKVKQIKVVRGDLKNPEIHLLDLSSVQSIASSDLAVKSNDIIYIEQTKETDRKVLNTIGPVVSILTTILILITYINNVQK